MKKTLYILLAFVLLTSCNEAKVEKNVKNRTDIALVLQNYNPSKNKNFIDITVENLINPRKRQLNISDSGKVYYSFINKKKSEVIFNYKSHKFSLIVSPGEKLNITLNIDELLDDCHFEKFKVTGTNANTNKLILAHCFYLDSLIAQSSSPFSRKGNDLVFKNKRLSEMKEQLAVFDNFVAQNNIGDEAFINWAKAQIRYGAGHDLCIFPFMRINRDLSIDGPYFSFMNEIKSPVKDAIVYQSYLKYLDILTRSLTIMSNISDDFKTERESLKKESISNFPILFTLIKSLPDNQARELIMAYAYKKSEKIPANYQDSLGFYVSDRLINQVEYKKKKDTATIISLIKHYDITEDEKSELLELYHKTRGKVVFHDFWSATCASCMQELPNYNDLISRTKNSNVVFVFYGIQMSKNKWAKTIDELNLKGKQILLSQNQLAFFEKYFGVYAIPHHHLVDPSGHIVHEKISQVFPDNYKQIAHLIGKYNGT